MKINNKFRIVLSLLCLVLIVGSLAVLLPSSAGNTECEHPRARIASRAVVETGEANEYARRTEYRCDECGEIIVQSNTLDDFKNYLPSVKDGIPVFSGNWSVGYISAVTGAYKPFNAQANASGWLCMAEDVADIWKADSHGAFRFASGQAPSFGLSSRTNDKISVCFTAPKDGVVAIDFTAMRTVTVGNLRFDILHKGKSLLNGGMELFSENCDSLEELNAVFEGVRLSVSEGDDLYFTFEGSAGNAILDGTFVSPRVEYVNTPFTVMTCTDGCSFDENGVCEKCGTVYWKTYKGLQTVYVVASDGTSRYSKVWFYDGMTWAEACRCLADNFSGYALIIEQDEMYNKVEFVYEDATYSVVLNGQPVRASDEIIAGAKYTVDLPAV